jgi:hypothetical protein
MPRGITRHEFAGETLSGVPTGTKLAGNRLPQKHQRCHYRPRTVHAEWREDLNRQPNIAGGEE